MDRFTTVTGVAAPLDIANCDTDRIIPARYLKTRRIEGFGQHLFRDARTLPDGTPDPAFPLNQPAYRDARILVADVNFACGSSREGAVYALADAGFRVVIAPSFGDIFFNNCFKNSVLPIVLPADQVAALRQALKAAPGTVMTVDLERQTITRGNEVIPFAVDPMRKRTLIEGLDDIAMTLEHGAAMAEFETRYGSERPWLATRP